MIKYIITKQEILEIFNLMNSFKSFAAKKLLKELPAFREKDTNFFKAMKVLVRDQGRSNIIAVDEIGKLFVEHGGGE